MMFWFAILGGIILAVFAVKKKFYSMWPVLFNVMVSIYLGVMILPLIVGFAEDIENSPYHLAGCILLTAIAVFAILQTITTTFFTGAFEVSFPRLFDNIGAGILGFVSGYIACTFICFLIFVCPFSDRLFDNKDILANSSTKTVIRTCDLVGCASFQCYNNASKVIEQFFSEGEQGDDEFNSENSE